MALVRSAAEALLRARDDFPHGPFRFLSDWGELLILPPEFAEEIRNEPKLSFGLAAMRVSPVPPPPHIPNGPGAGADMFVCWPMN